MRIKQGKEARTVFRRARKEVKQAVHDQIWGQAEAAAERGVMTPVGHQTGPLQSQLQTDSLRQISNTQKEGL